MLYEEEFKNKPLSKKSKKLYEILIKKIKTWLFQKVASANAKGIVLGISGGIDSTTLAFIANDVFKENAHFYYFKTANNNKIEDDIAIIEQSLKRKIIIIDLENEFNYLTKKLNLNNKMALANTKSRLYMTALYGFAQEKNALVLGTDNFNEYYLGYFTKYGDGGCDLLPFANIKKSDVYTIAKLINVPQEIINKRPSADLYENQFDEDELGFSYFEFEQYLIDENLISKSKKARIEELHHKTNHKRDLIPKGPKFK
ncbi:NAD(+) synthase [[Mycoplasma] anseris]|uniref:NH(3)-dependent NAD(+) synthetase n=1 Tax=[Mycoplasma] anseris TaxID=92400 RepID=A0A2Z4NDS1_9BACT|nr:NAD(+) synthase [[Mycoplasma] anseris]AWX69744.1 NAD(+) synthase [[Mycoplasma] anseris]